MQKLESAGLPKAETSRLNEFVVETFRRDDTIIGHLVSSPSFARGLCLANDGNDTRWRIIEPSLLKVSGSLESL